MGTVTAMLAEARRHIGYREGKTTPFGIWYGDQVHSSAYDSAAWCDMFLSYCAAVTDNGPAVGRFAYTPSHVNWFKSLGRWHNGKAGARAGDLVFFDWDGGVVDHVGIVEKVLSDGRLQTIEGNTSDACLRRVRSGSIAGYGRPAYTATPPAPKPPPPPPPWPGTYYQLRSPMMRGENVKWIQRRLNVKGASPKLGVDGVFGPRTERETRDYQKAHKLTVDGVVGPRTWVSLAK
jgi:hypothetical protein